MGPDWKGIVTVGTLNPDTVGKDVAEFGGPALGEKNVLSCRVWGTFLSVFPLACDLSPPSCMWLPPASPPTHPSTHFPQGCDPASS